MDVRHLVPNLFLAVALASAATGAILHSPPARAGTNPPPACNCDGVPTNNACNANKVGNTCDGANKCVNGCHCDTSGIRPVNASPAKAFPGAAGVGLIRGRHRPPPAHRTISPKAPVENPACGR